MTALYVGSLTAADMARVTRAPGAWTEQDGTAETLIPPPAPGAPVFPKTCRCCGWPTTAAEWEKLETRRAWPEFGLEVAECPSCPNTLSIPVRP